MSADEQLEEVRRALAHERPAVTAGETGRADDVEVDEEWMRPYVGARFYVAMWADAVEAQVDRYLAVCDRRRAQERDWGDTPVSGEDLMRTGMTLLVEAHYLVTAAAQLQKWAARAATEAGIHPGELVGLDEQLERVRNVLEHLDEAHVDDAYAHPNPDLPGRRPDKQAVHDLPGRRLPLYSSSHQNVFGILNVQQLVGNARGLAHRLGDDPPQEAPQ